MCSYLPMLDLLFIFMCVIRFWSSRSPDINECLEPGVCSQRCIDLPGSHKCECVVGYSRDPHDTSRCKAMEGHASLLFAHNTDIRKISLDHEEVSNLHAGSVIIYINFVS